MKRKVRQIFAIVAVVLLAGMYVTSLVLALIHNEWATNMLKLSMVLTVFVPIVLYFIMMFSRLARKDNSELFDEVEADNQPKDDTKNDII